MPHGLIWLGLGLLFIICCWLQLMAIPLKSPQIVSPSDPEIDDESWLRNRLSLKVAADLVLVLLMASIYQFLVPESWTLFYWFLMVLFFASLSLLLVNISARSFSHRLIYAITLPFLKINYLLNQKGRTEKDIRVSELEQVLENNEGETSDEDQKILEGIVQFSDTEVSQIMAPWSSLVSVKEDTELNEVIDIIKSHAYSRMPVFSSDGTTVIGTLHTKDILALSLADEENWQQFIRDIFVISEDKKIIDLLTEFRQKKKHLAMVTNHQGKFTGVVTLEDVIEEIVGDITDEFDDEEVIYSRINDSTYIFDGKTPLTELCRVLGLSVQDFVDRSPNSPTLGAFLSEFSGKTPRKNERINFGQLRFTVEGLDSQGVKRVKISLV